MPNAKWVFVRTVYQTKVDKDAQEGEVIMPPKSVSLFVLVDGNGIIQDQMAVKSVDTSTDVGQEGMELEIQWNKIVRQIRCSHVLRYRGFSDREFYLRIRQEHKKRDSGKGKGSATSIGRDEDPPSRKYRITYLYTDFCERGDLADLINRYRLPNKGNNFIPEQYIWYTLEQCAAAFSALQNGKCASPIEDVIAPDKDDKDKAKEWDALVHRDVKSLNILLGSPDEQYPSYARVLLADFDSVEYESRLAENPNDPDNWRYGTQDWLPPVRLHPLAWLLILS